MPKSGGNNNSGGGEDDGTMGIAMVALSCCCCVVCLIAVFVLARMKGLDVMPGSSTTDPERAVKCFGHDFPCSSKYFNKEFGYNPGAMDGDNRQYLKDRCCRLSNSKDDPRKDKANKAFQIGLNIAIAVATLPLDLIPGGAAVTAGAMAASTAISLGAGSATGGVSVPCGGSTPDYKKNKQPYIYYDTLEDGTLLFQQAENGCPIVTTTSRGSSYVWDIYRMQDYNPKWTLDSTLDGDYDLSKPLTCDNSIVKKHCTRGKSDPDFDPNKLANCPEGWSPCMSDTFNKGFKRGTRDVGKYGMNLSGMCCQWSQKECNGKHSNYKYDDWIYSASEPPRSCEDTRIPSPHHSSCFPDKPDGRDGWLDYYRASDGCRLNVYNPNKKAPATNPRAAGVNKGAAKARQKTKAVAKARKATRVPVKKLKRQ